MFDYFQLCFFVVDMHKMILDFGLKFNPWPREQA